MHLNTPPYPQQGLQHFHQNQPTISQFNPSPNPFNLTNQIENVSHLVSDNAPNHSKKEQSQSPFVRENAMRFSIHYSENPHQSLYSPSPKPQPQQAQQLLKPNPAESKERISRSQSAQGTIKVLPL